MKMTNNQRKEKRRDTKGKLHDLDERGNDNWGTTRKGGKRNELGGKKVKKGTRP